MASENAGRRGSTWEKLKANQRAKGLGCWLCGQPIDYTLHWPDPQSYSTDHMKSWIGHPELRTDPGNLASSHLLCNQQKGKNNAAPSLGVLTEDWG